MLAEVSSLDHGSISSSKLDFKHQRWKCTPTNSEMLSWKSYNEDISSLDDSSSIRSFCLLEQINVTRDTSDYLWYITSVDIGSTASFLHGGELPTLIVETTGHAMHVFINGQLSGSAFGTRKNRRFVFNGNANLCAGSNRIALLSVAVGLPRDCTVEDNLFLEKTRESKSKKNHCYQITLVWTRIQLKSTVRAI